MPTLAQMLDELKQRPNAGIRMLELARALFNRGRFESAKQAELAALALDDPEVTHRWRLSQAARAPANQFLLLGNRSRTEAFQRALERSVSPESLVLEIGTGSGILAMIAARAGAAEVISCERQAFMADTARAIIAENGLQQSITVIAKELHHLALGRDLPRRADVLVADLFTGALLEAGGLKLIRRARKHLVKQTCTVIPAAATLRACLVGGPDLEQLCRVETVAGFDLSPFNIFSPPTIGITPERFANLRYCRYSNPIDCFDFDFNSLNGFQPRRRIVDIPATNEGLVLGLLQWLRLELSPGNELESDEGSQLNWTRFVHVFPRPLPIRAGQTLTLHLEHDLNSFSVWPLE